MSVTGIRYRDSAKNQGNTEKVVFKKSCQDKLFLGKGGVFKNKTETSPCAKVILKKAFSATFSSAQIHMLGA